MRGVALASLVLMASVLAGCSGGGEGDDLHYVCSNGTTTVHADDHPEANATKESDLAKFCPGSSTTGSKSNTTSAAPNVLPNLVLTISDDAGTPTPVTMLNGNLTFSAQGSTDPDGQVAGIAVTVQDSNTTRTGVLYNAASKTFTDVTFKFDRAGVVNVTVAMVDDRAGFTVNQTHVYVNEMVTKGPTTVRLPDPTGDPTTCNGPVNPLVDSTFATDFSFTVHPGATFVEATATAGSIAICAPNPDPAATDSKPGEARSGAGQSVVTDPGADLTSPEGVKSYFVMAYATGPQDEISVTITVHYEPDTRAAA